MPRINLRVLWLRTNPAPEMSVFSPAINRILLGDNWRRAFIMPHLKLDQSLVDEARALARHIVEPVIDYLGSHTTVAIERATLRLIGVDGVDEEGIPLPNRVVDSALPLLPGGILRPLLATMLQYNISAQ